jgi:hypothetical protein
MDGTGSGLCAHVGTADERAGLRKCVPAWLGPPHRDASVHQQQALAAKTQAARQRGAVREGGGVPAAATVGACGAGLGQAWLGVLATYVGPTRLTWARHDLRGPDTTYVGPTRLTWARHGPTLAREAALLRKRLPSPHARWRHGSQAVAGRQLYLVAAQTVDGAADVEGVLVGRGHGRRGGRGLVRGPAGRVRHWRRRVDRVVPAQRQREAPVAVSVRGWARESAPTTDESPLTNTLRTIHFRAVMARAVRAPELHCAGCDGGYRAVSGMGCRGHAKPRVTHPLRRPIQIQRYVDQSR